MPQNLCVKNIKRLVLLGFHAALYHFAASLRPALLAGTFCRLWFHILNHDFRPDRLRDPAYAFSHYVLPSRPPHADFFL